MPFQGTLTEAAALSATAPSGYTVTGQANLVLGSGPKIQTTTAVTSVNSASLTATLATTPVSGNLLVAVCNFDQTVAGAFTHTAGWTDVFWNVGGNSVSGICYRIAGAAEPKTFTVSHAGAPSAVIEIWLSEWDSSHTILDQSVTNLPSMPVANCQTGSIATAAPSALFIGMVGTDNNDTYGSWTGSRLTPTVETAALHASGSFGITMSVISAQLTASGSYSATLAFPANINKPNGAAVTFSAVAAPPPAGNASRAQLGFYPHDGTTASQVVVFNRLQGGDGNGLSGETVIGRRIAHHVQMTGIGDTNTFNATTSDFATAGIYNYKLGQTGATTTAPQWTISVPTAFGAFSPNQAQCQQRYDATISGANDGAYDLLASRLNTAIAAGYTSTPVIIRLGWEFDGEWMPWSWHAYGQPGAVWDERARFKAGFQRAHDRLVAGVTNAAANLRFDLCGDAGWDQWWAPGYPGDGYVDILGMDCYWESAAGNLTPLSAGAATSTFNTYYGNSLTRGYNFAVAHGKQVSYPEWGLGGVGSTGGNHPDDSVWLTKMLDFMDALPASGPGSLAYHSYFNADPGGTESHALWMDGYVGGGLTATYFPNSQAIMKARMI